MMKKFFNQLFFLGLLFVMGFANAQFYSSMTKADFVEGNKSLKFTTKMNTEHISNAIKINPNTAGFEAEVKKYVNRNFNVAVNGSDKPLTFTGSQVNGESVWVYFEAGSVSDIKSLKIRNSILMDAYPKQTNVVNVAYKGQQKTMSFQKGRESSEISF